MNKFRINTMIDNFKYKILLKPKYRLVFCMILCFIIPIILTIMIGAISEIMSRITDVINYIVWGIK